MYYLSYTECCRFVGFTAQLCSVLVLSRTRVKKSKKALSLCTLYVFIRGSLLIKQLEKLTFCINLWIRRCFCECYCCILSYCFAFSFIYYIIRFMFQYQIIDYQLGQQMKQYSYISNYWQNITIPLPLKIKNKQLIISVSGVFVID